MNYDKTKFELKEIVLSQGYNQRQICDFVKDNYEIIYSALDIAGDVNS